MKKIIIFLLTLSFAIGCACTVDKASDAVKEYLGKYNNQNAEILTQLETVVKEENLSEEQSEKYKDIMTKQYKDLKYEIVEETYNGDEAVVTTKITVYDLYGAQQEAEEYKNNHRDEFLKDNKYDADAYLDYKLEQMKKKDKTVEYTIDFQVVKRDGKWVVKSISTEDLEKIHGIYNYEND